MCRAEQDAGRRYRDSDNKESPFIIHPKLTDPIPQTEKSLNVKLARKFPNKKRAKRQLAGLYEVLQPGSFATKSSPTTTIINEQGRSPVKVRDSDQTKLGNKAERSTNLWKYAQRRPAPYEQTTETKIAKHSNDLKKKGKDHNSSPSSRYHFCRLFGKLKCITCPDSPQTFQAST